MAVSLRPWLAVRLRQTALGFVASSWAVVGLGQPAFGFQDSPATSDVVSSDVVSADVMSSDVMSSETAYSSPTATSNEVAPPDYYDPALTGDGYNDGYDEGMIAYDAAGSYFTLRHVAGDGVANPDSFSTLGWFKPLFVFGSSEGDEGLWFLDTRLVVQNDGDVGGNFGLGYRQYNMTTNRIWGISVWDDADSTHRNFFHQVGVGLESLGESFDVRANGYLPVGKEEKSFGHTPLLGTYRYGGRNILLDRFRHVETAMRGFDVEVGTQVPGWKAHEYDLRGFVGYYRYDSDTGPEIDGISGRLQANLSPDLLVQLMATHDNHFDTNIMLGISWSFTAGFSESRGAAASVRERIGQPVQRNSNVVVTARDIYDPLVATNPITELPIIVVHANSALAAAGDGSFERPYNSLSSPSNPANTAEGDIIFAHADSIFDGQSLVMQNDQRFLGEGLDYMVDTLELGTIVMPRATDGTMTPIIRNSPFGAGAVNFASNAEVANFRIENAQGEGLLGDRAGGIVSLHDITIDGALRGLDIRNSGGTFDITNVPISNTTDDGILLTDNSSGMFTFNGTTQIANPSGIGLSIQGGSSTITFEDLEITNRTTTAIGIGRSSGDITFMNPITINNPNGALDEAIGIANTSGNITFDAVTINDNTRATLGMPSVLMGTNNSTVTFGSLDIQNNNGGGLRALNIAGLNINGGNITANGNPAVEINGAMAVDATLRSVNASNTNYGILLINSEGNFQISGDGTTAGSGGTIQAALYGVAMNNAENVSLNFLDVISPSGGVLAINSDNLVVNGSSFTSTADNWTGIAIRNTTDDGDGSPIILSGNTITGSGANLGGIFIQNMEAPQGSVRIDDSMINVGATNSFGITINATGNGPESGPGDIVLLSLQNNIVTSTPGMEFVPTENQATIFGQILINGNLVP